jgi:integrase
MKKQSNGPRASRIVGTASLAGGWRTRTENRAPALPPEHFPAFVSRLGREEGPAARAVEFGILTLARQAELAGTQWSDFSESMWRIPGQLRKCGDPRLVPLSARAIEVLQGLPRHGEFVFGRDTEHPLRSTSLLQILRRVNDADGGRWIDSLGRPIMFAGFRRTFCEWATKIAHSPWSWPRSRSARATPFVDL